MFKCSNCGGDLKFSPKDKGNKCQQCGGIEYINYVPSFEKRDIADATKKIDVSDLKSIKCKACGANIILNKFELQKVCPYCGNTEIVESKKVEGLKIDSIVPFVLTPEMAFSNFKKRLNRNWLNNKKIFRDVKLNNVLGLYVNAIAFDFDTDSNYKAILEFSRTTTDSDGDTYTEYYTRNVEGKLLKNYVNLTVEANSKTNQSDISKILPFDYSKSVEFNEDFMCGYLLESQDKPFDEYVMIAHNLVASDIKKEIIRKYNADRIVKIDLATTFKKAEYNYCLLPVYSVKTEYKKEPFNVFINGQNGKVGSIPKSGWKIFLLIMLILLGVSGITLLILHYMNIL